MCCWTQASKDVTFNGCAESMKGKGIAISSSEALELKKPSTQVSIFSNESDQWGWSLGLIWAVF